METIYDLAKPEDYEDVIDFGNYVFSNAHMPHNFPILLPKLCKREYFMDSIHYLAREGGKIKAAVGAYPVKMEFSGGVSLTGRGIGMVSVHPYSRSKGYMKDLMNQALSDMRKDGVIFSCLGGQRQRYEYFGYVRTGINTSFTCTETNVRHTLGADWKTNYTLKTAGPGDAAILENIRAMHEAKPFRYERLRDRFYDILNTWNAKILAVEEDGKFCGYIIYKAQGADHDISEINLADYSRLPELIGLFLKNGKAVGMKASVQVSVHPHEIAKFTAFNRFAEKYSQSSAYHFLIFDYLRFVQPFMTLKQMDYSLADGSFVLQIEGGKRFKLAVQGGAASISETSDRADLSLNDLDAQVFLFSPLASGVFPAVRKSVFLQSLLPLPLSYENADCI